jgi:hypothetical protein
MMLNAFCGSSGQQSALRGLGEHPMPFSKAETALPTMLAWPLNLSDFVAV